jgi:Tol biopolymer transport system component
MKYPDGEPEKILDHAFWPRISPDSSKIVYVSLEPVSGVNELFLANADGTNAQVVNTGGLQETGIMDAPFFTPDGQSIIFSAPDPTRSYQPNWLDRLMGIQMAKAHGAPADWWIVQVTGGEPTRLTQIQASNLFARMSPDRQHLVSFSINGLFVMELDGSNLTSITPDPSGSTVDWLP